MVSERDIKLEVDDEAKDWLAKLGYDVTYGARPLKRTIQKYLINPLSQELLTGRSGPRRHNPDNAVIKCGSGFQKEKYFCFRMI